MSLQPCRKKSVDGTVREEAEYRRSRTEQRRCAVYSGEADRAATGATPPAGRPHRPSVVIGGGSWAVIGGAAAENTSSE